MGIKEVFVKLRNFVNNQRTVNKGLTPNEVELMSFKRREYLDGIKKELAKYRLKASDEALRGTKISSSAPILTTPAYGQKKKRIKPCDILKVKNVFW